MGKNPFGQLLDKRQQLQEDRPPMEAAICFDWGDMENFLADTRVSRSSNTAFARGVALPTLEIFEGTCEPQVVSRVAVTDLNGEKAEVQVKDTRFGELKEPQVSRPEVDAVSASSVLRPLFYPDWPLNHSVRPDGSIKTEQAHPDGTVRIHSRFEDGSAQERITDRYARPFYVCDIAKNGTWTVSELQYQDNLGRISPFLAAKRITNSDGSVSEEHYNDYGKVTKRSEYRLKSAS